MAVVVVEGRSLIVTRRGPLAHGKRHTYLKGCRCGDCTHAASTYKQLWRQRTGKR